MRSDPPRSNVDAILAVAGELFAARGPADVTIREIAERAGCSHTLVGRHYGSKAGLERAVVERLADELGAVTAGSTPALGALLDHLARRDETSRLLVRCALGELPADALASDGNCARAVADELANPVGAYMGLSLALGWLAFDEMLRHSSRIPDSARRIRATTVAAGCGRLTDFVVTDPGTFVAGKTRSIRKSNAASRANARATAHGTEAVRRALVDAAVEFMSTPGPASFSTREIARRAGVNQGQIYHLFGSKERLVAAAIESTAAPFLRTVTESGTFDIATAAQLRAGMRYPAVVARVLVNGVDILTVREHFPIFDALFEVFPAVPTTKWRGAPDDPRSAVFLAGAFFQGASLWDTTLRKLLGIPAGADLTATTETVIEFLLGRPPR